MDYSPPFTCICKVYIDSEAVMKRIFFLLSPETNVGSPFRRDIDLVNFLSCRIIYGNAFPGEIDISFFVD